MAACFYGSVQRDGRELGPIDLAALVTELATDDIDITVIPDTDFSSYRSLRHAHVLKVEGLVSSDDMALFNPSLTAVWQDSATDSSASVFTQAEHITSSGYDLFQKTFINIAIPSIH